MLAINVKLLNGVLIRNSDPIHFFLPQIVHFDTSINLFCLVLLTVECLVAVFSFSLQLT